VSSGPNNSQARGKVHLYAVVRHDPQSPSPQAAFAVKEVLPTLEEAEAEVQRLNGAARGGTVYFWQTTRFYPAGRRVGTDTKTRRKATMRLLRPTRRG
jgi:hypothetical protein